MKLVVPDQRESDPALGHRDPAPWLNFVALLPLPVYDSTEHHGVNPHTWACPAPEAAEVKPSIYTDQSRFDV
jgi:hypothetical protein